MEGRFLDSRWGKVIACILYCLMVVSPLVIELFVNSFDLSSANGFNWPLLLLLSCLSVLHCFGAMTNISFISRFTRILFYIIFYLVIGLVLIMRFITLFDGTPEPSGPEYAVNLAKEAGYFGFVYLTNTLLLGINGASKREMYFQNFRWILLFVSSAAVVPLMIAFSQYLDFASVVVIGFFFVVFDVLYSLPNGNSLTILGHYLAILLSIVSIIVGIVMYANSIVPLVSAAFISFAGLSIGYVFSMFKVVDMKEREEKDIANNEFWMCFGFPIAIIVVGIGLGFVSLAASWAVYVSMGVSVLVVYLIVKYALFRENENYVKSTSYSYSAFDLLPSNYTNRDAVEAICSDINDSDLFCGTYSHQFFAYARAHLEGVYGSKFVIRVSYEIYSSPEDRSVPNRSEDSDLMNDAYRKVRAQFSKHQNLLKPPYSIDIRY